jgi:hypothetical protein
MIANRHPDVARIAAEILSGYHPAAAKGECVGAAQAYQHRANRSQTKQHRSSRTNIKHLLSKVQLPLTFSTLDGLRGGWVASC